MKELGDRLSCLIQLEVHMPGWNCPECHAENGILDMECKACGRSRIGTWGAGISRSTSSFPRDLLHGRGRSILDEIKADLARSSGSIGRVVDAPAAAAVFEMPDRRVASHARSQGFLVRHRGHLVPPGRRQTFAVIDRGPISPGFNGPSAMATGSSWMSLCGP